MRAFNMRKCLEVVQVDDVVDNCVHLCTVCGRLARVKVLLGTDLRIYIKKQHGGE